MSPYSQWVKIPQSSRRTRADWTGVNLDGTTVTIESKFGTSQLTANQRLAEQRVTGYVVDYWTYDWVGGAGANAAASGW